MRVSTASAPVNRLNPFVRFDFHNHDTGTKWSYIERNRYVNLMVSMISAAYAECGQHVTFTVSDVVF